MRRLLLLRHAKTENDAPTGQDQDRRSTREAGFDSHLVKPVDVGVLRDVLAGAGA